MSTGNGVFALFSFTLDDVAVEEVSKLPPNVNTGFDAGDSPVFATPPVAALPGALPKIEIRERVNY